MFPAFKCRMFLLPVVLKMTIEIMERADAQKKGRASYFTGRPCKRGHVAVRRTGCGTCVECSALTVSKWQKANPERVKAASDKWYAANPEKARQKSRRWHSENREKSLQASRAYRAKNGEKINALTRAWQAANPAKKNAINARRRAAQHNATPTWSDMDDILSFYEEAARKTAATGVPHHVDHIVPLQGRTVCGLHVAWNLQVLSETENLAKKNSQWPNMWPEFAEAGNAT